MDWWIILLIVIGVSIPILIGIYIWCRGGKANLTGVDLTDKTILVTGPTGGIGKETVKVLLELGAEVIFACRSKKRMDAVLEGLPQEQVKRAKFAEVALDNFESVNSFCDSVSRDYAKIDIILNNAGIVAKEFCLTKDNLESTLQVNHLSHMILTSRLYDKLPSDTGRIINLSSMVHSSPDLSKFDWNPSTFFESESNYGSNSTYAYSKLLNIYFTKFLVKYGEKKGNSISVTAVHPGVVRTGLLLDFFGKWYLKIAYYLSIWLFLLIFKTDAEGAQTSIHLCTANRVENGAYYKDCHVAPTSKQAQDEDLQNKAMEYSFKILENKEITDLFK